MKPLFRSAAALAAAAGSAAAPAQDVRAFLAYGDPAFAAANGAAVGAPLGGIAPVRVPRSGTFVVQLWVVADRDVVFNAGLGFLAVGRGEGPADDEPFPDAAAFAAADRDGVLIPDGGPDWAGSPAPPLDFPVPPVLRAAAAPTAGERPLGVAAFFGPPPGQTVPLPAGAPVRLYDVRLATTGRWPADEVFGDGPAPDGGVETGLFLPPGGGYADGQNLLIGPFGTFRPPPVRHAVVPAPPRTVVGRWRMADWLGAEAGPPVRLEVAADPAGPAVFATWAAPEADGAWRFALDDPALDGAGRVWLRAKPDRGLSRDLGAVDLGPVETAAPDADFAMGDADGDDQVTVFDYDALSAAFDTAAGDAGWNPLADFDGDGAVTVFDYDILSRNFDRAGDP